MKIYPIALHFAKEDQHFAKYFKNPQNIAQTYGHSAKVAKFSPNLVTLSVANSLSFRKNKIQYNWWRLNWIT